MPAKLRANANGAARARVEVFREYVGTLLEIVAPHVPCVKLQSACFERYRWMGVEVYEQLISEARRMGLIVIADAKRGDIGVSAAHYAAGCLGDAHFEDMGEQLGADALTINSYFGDDGIEPFVELAAAQGKGLFALVRTSNPGGDLIQSLPLADGRQVCDVVAELVARLGRGDNRIGQGGYSLLGAVVGATKAADAARLRAQMPEQIFLVPGFGAQGGSADDVRACFKPDGSGAIVTASRSVIYAYEESDEADWWTSVEAAAIDLKQQVAAILS